MIARPKETEINPKDPFHDDQFERKHMAEGLVRLLSRMEGPLTLALTGAYGSGKTHFLRRCQALLEKEEIPVVLLNAWETDFASEPIAPLISEFTEKFAKKLPTSDKTVRKIKGFAARLAAAAVPLGVKLLTAGILEAEDFKDAVADAAQKAAEKQFEHFEASKRNIEALRTELSALAEKIRPEKTPRPPLVVIIDELDRCRPTYAIELLEVVKHLFSIPGIVFVLGIDRHQLASSARAVFGQGLDADAYLRRFIDLECALPAPDVARFCDSAGMAVITQTTGYTPRRPRFDLLSSAGVLCRDAAFSIRQTMQFLTRLGIASAAAELRCDDPESITLLTFLREFDEGLYRRFTTQQATAWEVFERLKKMSPGFLVHDSYSERIPFLHSLAVIGSSDKPFTFIDAFIERTKPAPEVIKYLEQVRSRMPNNWREHVRTLSNIVDFGAAFVAR